MGAVLQDDRRADDGAAGDDPLVSQNVAMEQRAHDGQQHSQRCQIHPAAGRFGRTERLQAQDKQHAGREIQDLQDMITRHELLSLAA